MHQALELPAKALAFALDPGFQPKQFSHNAFGILKKYSDRSANAASLVANSDVMSLFHGLERSYLGVRYAESYYSTDRDDWDLYCRVAIELAEEIHRQSGFCLLQHHRRPSGPEDSDPPQGEPWSGARSSWCSTRSKLR